MFKSIALESHVPIIEQGEVKKWDLTKFSFKSIINVNKYITYIDTF
jgi:hypothetical protein